MRVFERHLTLCGETHLAGLPCALVRFAGCDLRCRWCDTVRAQDPDSAAGEDLNVDQIVAWVDSVGASLVLLTGGEPLLQPELPQLAVRLALRYQVLVETSGAHDIRCLPSPVVRSVDIKGPSSGEQDRMCWDNLRHLRLGDVVKLVIADRADYEYAREVIQRHALGVEVNILLSSAYPHLRPQQLAAWIIEDLQQGRRFMAAARLNVQLHLGAQIP